MLRNEINMKLKPRFHILFFIYIFFGGIFTGLLIYIFSYRMGEKTELNYKKIVEAEIRDTIINIADLPTKDFAYPHAGGIQCLEIKRNKDLKIPLYLESYINEKKINIGDRIQKEKDSRIIQIYSTNKDFSIELRDLVKLRKQKGKTEAIKWIIVYLIIGTIILFVPIKTNKEMKINKTLATTRNIKNWAENGKYEHFNIK